jgi:hypothetical protein
MLDWHISLLLTGANKWRRVKGRDKRLDRLDAIKMKMDLNMDELTFQNKMKDTQVVLSSALRDRCLCETYLARC